MDSTTLRKLVRKEEITDEDIARELSAICEHEHSHCLGGSDCPMIELLTEEQIKSCTCPYFKNGRKMLEALRR